MAEHPNATLLRRGFEAFGKRDMATLTELFSEGVAGHVAGSSPFSGEHKGREAWFAVLRRLAEGDYAATLTQLFAEEAVWHLPGEGPLSGDHRGRERVLAAMRQFEELSGGTIRVEVHDVPGSDQQAVALTRATASRRGKQLDLLGSHVYHARNGKVTEVWWFWQDQRVFDEFWS